MAQGNPSAGTGFSGPAFSPDLYKTLSFYQRGQKLSTEGRTTGDQEDPAGSAGAKQRGGRAPPFPRNKLQKKTEQKGSLGRTQD